VDETTVSGGVSWCHGIKPITEPMTIITGGAEGIGRSYASGFAKEGAIVVIADINLDSATMLANSMTKQGYQALAVKTDVSRQKDTENVVRVAIERYGKIDILVNNAAKFQRNPVARKPVWELSLEEWEAVIRVNLTGVFLCCRAILPYMIKQKSGKIINVASSLAFSSAAMLSHYSASKGGVLTFTRALAKEVGQFNINVNTLCPGYTLSADLSSMTEEAKQFEIPLRIFKRAEYPEDLVGTAIYLASADSDFMTGQALVVDGGVVLH
jgi:3-oxoacyl-[acyl-carrier protein] reductase